MRQCRGFQYLSLSWRYGDGKSKPIACIVLTTKTGEKTIRFMILACKMGMNLDFVTDNAHNGDIQRAERSVAPMEFFVS
jgi:hypothetical protein